MSTHKISEERCRSMITGVCSQCGGSLEPIDTVDNGGDPTFWSGCLDCSLFDWGVDPLVFKIAKQMVTTHGYRAYTHTDCEKSQIGGTVSTVLLVKEVLQGFGGDFSNAGQNHD